MIGREELQFSIFFNVFALDDGIIWIVLWGIAIFSLWLAVRREQKLLPAKEVVGVNLVLLFIYSFVYILYMVTGMCVESLTRDSELFTLLGHLILMSCLSVVGAIWVYKGGFFLPVLLVTYLLNRVGHQSLDGCVSLFSAWRRGKGRTFAIVLSFYIFILWQLRIWVAVFVVSGFAG